MNPPKKSDPIDPYTLLRTALTLFKKKPAELQAEDSPVGITTWDEMALAPDPEVAFWAQVWRLRS